MEGELQVDKLRCPECGQAGILSATLFASGSLGSEAPEDFEVLRCSNRHYWRVWDDGRIENLTPELNSNV